MLVNTDKKVFVGQRLDNFQDAWQMPQGGIDEGETPEQAALRELVEETGVTKARIIRQTNDWYYYDLPPELAANTWSGQYKGQMQKWFLMEFTGTNADVNINTAHPEFRSWQWQAPQELLSIIVPFKQELYAKVLEEFRYFLVGS